MKSKRFCLACTIITNMNLFNMIMKGIKTANLFESLPVKINPLINCIRLPIPKHLKPGAKLSLDEERVAKNIIHKGPEEKRGQQVVYGFDTKLYAPVAFASNQHNEYQALNARVLANTIEPEMGCTGTCKPHKHSNLCRRNDDELLSLPSCIRWCKKNHRLLFPCMYKIKSVDFAIYLKRSNASPSVKRILQTTYEELQKEGYDENSILTADVLHQWTKRSSFVKVENNLYQSPMGKKDKAPRLIQGAQPEFIVLVGPWIMALQDLFKRRWCTKKSNKVFTSGVSSEDAADFISKASGAILEDDLGKFDCSIREMWCEYEVWLCKQFGAPCAILDLMTANIETHGTTHHGWKYKCMGTRKSGDPYTSLMNSIINGLSHEYIYCFLTKCDVKTSKINLKMLLQGDDNLLRHAEYTKLDWRKSMAALGFDSEAIYRSTLHTAEFCSNRLYLIDRGYIFGPKPGKVLAKFGYIINPPKKVTRESMMRGVALGLQKLCNHIPPIKIVIDRVLELTEGHEAWYERNFQEHIMKTTKIYDTTIEVMTTLSDQYEWDYGKQALFHFEVSNMQLGDAYSTLPHLLFDRDTSAPQYLAA